MMSSLSMPKLSIKKNPDGGILPSIKFGKDTSSDSEEQAPLGDSENGIVEPTLVTVKSSDSGIRTSLMKRARMQRNRSLPLGLVVQTYAIHKDGDLVPCTVEEVLSAETPEPIMSYWIDLKMNGGKHDQEELRKWLRANLNLTRFVTRRLVEEQMCDWHSGLMYQKKTALIIMRCLTDAQVPDYQAALQFNDNVLATFSSIRTGSELFEYFQDPEALINGTSSATLLAWLGFHVERSAMEMRRLRDFALKLDEKMDESPELASDMEIKELKNDLLRQMAVSEEQTETLKSLSLAEKEESMFDFSGMRGTYGILLTTAKSTDRLGERIERRLNNIRQAFDAHQQSKLNNRLATLTVISAIFMPLTFMAGIYGMNFENMPELEYENSYFIFLGVIASLAIAMLLFFYLRGWFVRS